MLRNAGLQVIRVGTRRPSSAANESLRTPRKARRNQWIACQPQRSLSGGWRCRTRLCQNCLHETEAVGADRNVAGASHVGGCTEVPTEPTTNSVEDGLARREPLGGVGDALITEIDARARDQLDGVAAGTSASCAGRHFSERGSESSHETPSNSRCTLHSGLHRVSASKSMRS